MNIAKAMIKARIAYTEPTFMASGKFISMPRGLNFGYIHTYVFGSRIVTDVVIRGTDTKGKSFKDCARSWARNLSAIDRINDTLDPGIHDGFAGATRMFKDTVLGHIHDVRPAEVNFIGHSAGAPVAGNLAWEASKTTWQRKLNVFAFASPAWCDKNIRNQIDSSPINYTNIDTKYDIVPKCVPKATGLRRPGKTYIIHTKKWVPIPYFFKITRGIIDHDPDTYLKYV